MKIFVINAGSSSLKYQLIDMDTQALLCKGLCERIGIDGKLTHKCDKGTLEKDVPMKSHSEAIAAVLEALTDAQYGCIESLDEISAVGHRIVHGGELFKKSTLITEEVAAKLETLIPLGPLHMPANIMGVKACSEVMPSVPQVAVFDTSFHQTMPEEAYLYGLPYEYYEKYAIRRYGFHGTSHRYVTKRTAEILGKPENEVNIITCHLGNGSSLACIKGGKVVDTTMGLTPLEGMMMGTRCGNIDPAIVCFLGENENLTYAQLDNIMNKKSGLLGVSGISSDFRDVEAAAKEGNHRAEIALEMFKYQVKKLIGGYIAVLGGNVDAIVFTAGVGENSGIVRKGIVEGLENMGICVDPASESIRGKEALISTPESKIKLYIVPTNEELMIARDTEEIVNSL